MTSKVKVNMRLCGKTHIITVNMREDGDLDCNIETNCANVKEFSEGLEKVSMNDLTDKATSGIVDRYRDCRMSANCLVPAGLISAGWMEVGMISRNNARKNKANDVEFLFDD
ncbi:DUF6951 family protein [Methanomassiliicoccus luminyensis]|uniref:DUF6951 family protein n=1 Tax=Methanomassiliicoccus luminyensis TaxID=1080712 RepID=UPI000368A21B|nr:hypothetical protein [Methanomassiliicoccus luminyensis]